MAVTGIEMLAQFDLSLMVKAGVQWGLFGGAVENLGTQHHHDTYIRDLINLDLVGCFAMTETGHGSDVQNLETTATYDQATQEFVINSPTPSSRKDYIGNAGKHATMAAVFAQLITRGETYGVHCFLVPIRDEHGEDLPGVTTSDCGHKGGLAGVDNGRIMFDEVRVPRQNLLNRYGQVDEGGAYSSPIDEHRPPVLHDARHPHPRPGERRRLGQRDGRGRAHHRRAVRVAASAVRPVARRRRSCSPTTASTSDACSRSSPARTPTASPRTSWSPACTACSSSTTPTRCRSASSRAARPA